MTLTLEEFLRRFLQPVLPKGLPRIRYFGWFANRRRGESSEESPTESREYFSTHISNPAHSPTAESMMTQDRA
jgi:hypothetical protein